MKMNYHSGIRMACMDHKMNSMLAYLAWILLVTLIRTPNVMRINLSIVCDAFDFEKKSPLIEIRTFLSAKRTQSLLDLRTVLPPKELYYQQNFHDQVDGRQSAMNNFPPNNRHCSNSKLDKASDPIYYTISMDEKSSKLGRNCVSLQNLDALTFKNDLSAYGNNLLQNYNAHRMYPPQQYVPVHSGYHPVHNYFPYWYPFSGYAPPPPGANQFNPYIGRMSKQSLGNESDDYRKYRDVAL